MELKMRKIADPSNNHFDCAVEESLSTIKKAHVRLHLLTDTTATATFLASQIQLCDVLLDEISDIHTNLARDLKYTRLTPLVSGRPRMNA